MINYKPVPFSKQVPFSTLRGPQLSVSPGASPTPPPMPDFLLTGYTGVPGFLETLTVLAISGAAAWVGITAGTKKQNSTLVRTAGWVGGVGSALIGLLYLGGKSGLNDYVGLPAVRIS